MMLGVCGFLKVFLGRLLKLGLLRLEKCVNLVLKCMWMVFRVLCWCLVIISLVMFLRDMFFLFLRML